MPYRMHSEYLRALFLENRLTAGRYSVEGRVVALSDIRVPMFIVGTESDHIAPWRSVYKTHLFTRCPITFVLTKGGHNAGIVSEPGHPRRHYSLGKTVPGECYRDPDTWLSTAIRYEGSWWPEWASWIASVSTQERARPPQTGAPAAGIVPLEDAPGQYVREP
jgi:polyhydroxyalkanoate synthase